MLNFVALDFETANEERSSACALGAVVVKNGEIAKTLYSLIRPHETCFYFDPFNTEIHGITEDDVTDSPEFPQVWEQIIPFLNDNVLVAHFSSFDCSVIRHDLALYQMPFPECKILCSCNVSKRQWPDLLSHSLPNVAQHIGFNFEHHRALEDAKAATAIILESAKLQNVDTCEDLNDKLKLRLGFFHNGQYSPSSRYMPTSKSIALATPLDLANPALNPDDYPFWDKDVVFTGTLHSMKRESAFNCIIAAGGRAQNGVTKKTDYLVMGLQDYTQFRDGERSSKTLKAEELKKQGCPIEILSESDFLNMLGSKYTTSISSYSKINKMKETEQEKQFYAEEIQPKFDKALDIIRVICTDTVEPQRIQMNQRKFFSVITLDGKEDMPLCCIFTKGNTVSAAFYDENKKQMNRSVMFDYDVLRDNSFNIKNTIRQYLGMPVLEASHQGDLIRIVRKGMSVNFSINSEHLNLGKIETLPFGSRESK